MFQVKQTAWILTIMLAMSFLLAACGGKTVVQPPQPVQAPVDGQIESISKKPDPPPAWLDEPNVESDQEYLAFRGRSLDMAHPRYAERSAYQDAQLSVAGYLHTHVDSRVQESLRNSGVSSAIHDPKITEETVNKIVSKVDFSEAYLHKYYTEYFRRCEQGRWRYFYQVQALVKFPRDKVAEAAGTARRDTLEGLKKKTEEGLKEETEKDLIIEKIQQIIEREPPSHEDDETKPEGSIWALLVGIVKFTKNCHVKLYHFASM